MMHWVQKFWKTFKKAKNTELIEFGFELKRRYTKSVYPELNPEKEFLEKLKEKLELEIGKHGNSDVFYYTARFIRRCQVQGVRIQDIRAGSEPQ